MSDEYKKKQLRKHKAIATGLFFLMAIIYGLMVYFQRHSPAPWMGYVEAFSEAGMVGALADWFAVTALFRHPLGLPIPHTNLINRKKNDLGKNLGKFVSDNFMGPDNIRPYIEKLDVVKIVSGWFSKPSNKDLLAVELTHLLEKIIRDLDDRQVEDFLTQKGVDMLNEVDFQKLTAKGIDYAIQRGEHINLLENILPEIKVYIQENEDMILRRIESNRPLIALLAGKKITREITDGIVSFIQEVENNKHHFVRIKLTETMRNFSEELKETSKWDEKFANLKAELLTFENLQPYTQDAWKAIKDLIIQQLEDPESKMQEYLRKNIDKLANTLEEDEALKLRLNTWIRHFAYRMVLKNRQEIEDLISHTVEGWEGKELSEKLELEVGKDLQFIRVNGTLVGGLVGLIIYFITHLFI